MCGDFQNFNTLIMDKYPELVEYWLEIYHVMVRQEQRIEDLKTDNLKLQGLKGYWSSTSETSRVLIAIDSYIRARNLTSLDFCSG